VCVKCACVRDVQGGGGTGLGVEVGGSRLKPPLDMRALTQAPHFLLVNTVVIGAAATCLAAVLALALSTDG
jgi:hypothetical protein